jgi:hypothetical protein
MGFFKTLVRWNAITPLPEQVRAILTKKLDFTPVDDTIPDAPVVDYATVCYAFMCSEIGPLYAERVDTVEGTFDKSHFLGYLWETWNKAFMCLRWAIKLYSQSGRSLPAPGSTRLRFDQVAAVTPNFLTDEDIQGMHTARAGVEEGGEFYEGMELQKSHQALERLFRTSTYEDWKGAGLDIDHETLSWKVKNAHTLSEFVNELEAKKVLESVRDLEKYLRIACSNTSLRSGATNKDKIQRPKVHEAQVAAFIDELSERTTVVWGAGDAANALERVRREWEAEHGTALNLNSLDNQDAFYATAQLTEPGKAPDVDERAFLQGDMPRPDDTETDVDESNAQRNERFLQTVRKAMTSTSAPIPDYQKALVWAGYADGERLVLEGSPRPPGTNSDGQPLEPYALQEHQLVSKLSQIHLRVYHSDRSPPLLWQDLY